MLKVFVSMPMKNKSTDRIRKEMERIKEVAEKRIDQKLELIDSIHKAPAEEEVAKPEGFAIPPAGGTPTAQIEDLRRDAIKNNPVYWLGKSIELMAQADYVMFAKGFDNAKGCAVEFAVADSYGMKLLFEDEQDKDAYNFMRRYMTEEGERNAENEGDFT